MRCGCGIVKGLWPFDAESFAVTLRTITRVHADVRRVCFAIPAGAPVCAWPMRRRVLLQSELEIAC